MIFYRIALYQALINQANALKSLQHEYQTLQERERSLGDILDNLRAGYNPNYQDMAVLEAVRGWEQISHINDIGKTNEDVTDEEAGISQGEDKREEGEWSREDLETKLDSLLNTDYESLLLAHEEHIHAPVETSSCSFNLIPLIQLLNFRQCSILLTIFRIRSWVSMKSSKIPQPRGSRTLVLFTQVLIQHVMPDIFVLGMIC